MKQFILGLVIGIAILAPASANSNYMMTPNAFPPATVAGEVNALGVPIRGSGFTAKHLSEGYYSVRFENGRVRGCAAMVAATGAAFSTVNTLQHNCSRTFYIRVGDSSGRSRDASFHFIVVQE